MFPECWQKIHFSMSAFPVHSTRFYFQTHKIAPMNRNFFLKERGQPKRNQTFMGSCTGQPSALKPLGQSGTPLCMHRRDGGVWAPMDLTTSPSTPVPLKSGSIPPIHSLCLAYSVMEGDNAALKCPASGHCPPYWHCRIRQAGIVRRPLWGHSQLWPGTDPRQRVSA